MARGEFDAAGWRGEGGCGDGLDGFCQGRHALMDYCGLFSRWSLGKVEAHS